MKIEYRLFRSYIFEKKNRKLRQAHDPTDVGHRAFTVNKRKKMIMPKNDTVEYIETASLCIIIKKWALLRLS